MKFIRSVATGAWKSLLEAQQAILITCVTVLTLSIIISIIMRYAVKQPVLGITEIAITSALWLYLIGAAWGSKEKSHVYAGVMETLLKTKPYALKVFNTIIDVFILAVSCYAAILACQFVLWDISSGRRTDYFLFSRAYMDGSLLVGFVLMVVYSLIHVVRDVTFFTKRFSFTRGL